MINVILRLPASVWSRVHTLYLRLLGAKIHPNCRLVAPDVPRNPWDIELSQGVALDRGVTLLATGPRRGMPRISIGTRTYVNRYTFFDASIQISVGRDVMIGPFCYITDHDHGTLPGARVSDQPLVEKPVIIGDNVWVGAGVKILKGVTVGDNAVLAAGSVVTRDVPTGAVVTGIPAKVLKPST